MHHLPGYKPCDASNHMLRLKKTLYGLKQSGRRWYQKLSSIFESLSMPMDPAICLTNDQSPTNAADHVIMCDKPYHEAVGALNWAILATHPDIAYAISTVARFAANPVIPH